jgi:molybdopterin converting factor subunit 1
VKLRYFAWLRSRIGRSGDELPLPPGVHTVADLLGWLGGRPGYEAALARPDLVRVAVNHEYVGPEHRLGDDDEVALFPPVTGG